MASSSNTNPVVRTGTGRERGGSGDRRASEPPAIPGRPRRGNGRPERGSAPQPGTNFCRRCRGAAPGPARAGGVGRERRRRRAAACLPARSAEGGAECLRRLHRHKAGGRLGRGRAASPGGRGYRGSQALPPVPGEGAGGWRMWRRTQPGAAGAILCSFIRRRQWLKSTCPSPADSADGGETPLQSLPRGKEVIKKNPNNSPLPPPCAFCTLGGGLFYLYSHRCAISSHINLCSRQAPPIASFPSL